MRIARKSDLQSLYELAKLTGGGFTNLPPDRATLEAKLEASEAALSRMDDAIGDDLFMMVLENTAKGEVRGTCQIFSQVGAKRPFYSYRIGALTQTSRELDRTFRADMLSLSTDLEGSSEVGGLFLHPQERASGLGLLIARSRYLFIRKHRARFADRVLAELRGVIDESGGSPFWDGLGGKFFGMSFQEADVFNATRGNQFIADLMPKHPIYTAMLPDGARAVIGVPHPSGRAAMRMLESENFRFDRYVDIFDGGPTMIAETDSVYSIARAADCTITEIGSEGRGRQGLVAIGELGNFLACFAWIDWRDGGLAIDPAAAALLDAKLGDTVTYVLSPVQHEAAKRHG